MVPLNVIFVDIDQVFDFDLFFCLKLLRNAICGTRRSSVTLNVRKNRNEKKKNTVKTWTQNPVKLGQIWPNPEKEQISWKRREFDLKSSFNAAPSASPPRPPAANLHKHARLRARSFAYEATASAAVTLTSEVAPPAPRAGPSDRAPF